MIVATLQSVEELEREAVILAEKLGFTLGLLPDKSLHFYNRIVADTTVRTFNAVRKAERYKVN